MANVTVKQFSQLYLMLYFVELSINIWKERTMQKNNISQERSSLAKTKILTNMLCHAGQFIMQ